MKRKTWINWIVVLGLLISTGILSPAPPTARAETTATIWYVVPGGTGTKNCSSWTDACSLDEAVTTAIPDTDIWVATGVYTPGITITDTFQLQDGVSIFGGFDPVSGADEHGERDWESFPTVLSGDIGGDDTTDPNGVVTTTINIAGSNSYHVVTASGTGSTAVLDGFTITAGNADGTDLDDSGGGMYNSSSSPMLTNVTFSGNAAIIDGGGMYNDNSSPTLSNVTFSGNSADFGGGMYNDDNSSPSVRNSILWNNQDNSGTGTITATITNDNSTITLTHSLAQGCGGSDSWTSDTSFVDGGNNLESDPLFVLDVDPSTAPTTSGDLRLGVGSPAINAGDNQYVTGVPTDLDGALRVSGGSVDMGAYEFQFFYTLTISLAGMGSGSVSSVPSGITCTSDAGSDCSETYDYSTVVILTANPDSGSTFSGWSGVCTNTSGDCVVTMDTDIILTATFEVSGPAEVFLPLIQQNH